MDRDTKTKIYLGYEDEYVTDKHRSFVNYTTNKIGGKPVSKFQKFKLFEIECLIFLF